MFLPILELIKDKKITFKDGLNKRQFFGETSFVVFTFPNCIQNAV